MKKTILKRTELDLIQLGLYQIVGGAVGLLMIIWSFFKTPPSIGLSILLYLFILVFFTYSVFCGMLCLNANKSALKHSLINQILQVLGFAMLGFAFKYVAGFYFTIGLDLTDSINVGFGVGISKLDFNFNNERERLEVDFNLIAFALIYWIDKLMKKVKLDEEIKQLALNGNI